MSFRYYFIGIFCAVFFNSVVYANNAFVTTQLQKTLEAVVSDNAIAGAVMSVSTPDHGMITVVAGYSDTATKKAMRADDTFRIASMSKTYLAVTVLKLVAQGKLNLDQKIVDLLPSTIHIKRIANGDQVTVRQLLQMRSGIPSYTDYDAYLNKIGQQPDHDWTILDVIPVIYDQAATFAPDQAYEYSNTNYILLQSIVEHVTGATLSVLERKYIFDPLNLQDTYAEVQEKRSAGFNGLTAHGYDIIDKKVTDVTTLNDGFGLGDGNIISTIADMNLFVRALLVNKTLLPDDLLQQMLSMKDDYGLGIFNEPINGQTAWSHSGHSSGFSGEYYYLPEKKITIVILTNDANSEFFDELASKALNILDK